MTKPFDRVTARKYRPAIRRRTPLALSAQVQLLGQFGPWAAAWRPEQSLDLDSPKIVNDGLYAVVDDIRGIAWHVQE